MQNKKRKRMNIIERKREREEKLGRATIANNNKINEEYEDQNKKSSKKNTIKKIRKHTKQ